MRQLVIDSDGPRLNYPGLFSVALEDIGELPWFSDRLLHLDRIEITRLWYLEPER